MNPRLIKTLWITGGLVLVITIVGIVLAGRDELPPPPNDTNIVSPNGGSVLGERISNRSWALTYDRMVANADQTVVDLYGVKNGVIFKKGKPYLHVNAAHLTVNTVSRDFSANGPLRVATVSAKPPRSFYTDSASWSDATQKLFFAHTTTISSGAARPLVVGSMSLDVKTGEADITDIAGAIRFK